MDELSTYYATGVGKLESFEVKKEVKRVFSILFGASLYSSLSLLDVDPGLA